MNKLTVSQKALRLRERKAKEANPDPVREKRDDIFSQSRDVREDRDTRQVKAAEQPKTFPHNP